MKLMVSFDVRRNLAQWVFLLSTPNSFATTGYHPNEREPFLSEKCTKASASYHDTLCIAVTHSQASLIISLGKLFAGVVDMQTAQRGFRSRPSQQGRPE
jgi:hypothetical protein